MRRGKTGTGGVNEEGRGIMKKKGLFGNLRQEKLPKIHAYKGDLNEITPKWRQSPKWTSLITK